jgi:hypothetical protein
VNEIISWLVIDEIHDRPPKVDRPRQEILACSGRQATDSGAFQFVFNRKQAIARGNEMNCISAIDKPAQEVQNMGAGPLRAWDDIESGVENAPFHTYQLYVLLWRNVVADYDPIYITLNDQPRSILRGMNDLISKQEQVKETFKRRRWLPLGLLLGSLPFICIDLAFSAYGYRMFVFSLVTVACWIAALIAFIALRRARDLKIPPLYNTAKEIIYTLRDDSDPKRPFFGFLDLTGAQTPNKVARETTDAFKRVTQHYRDEWLNLKAKLYDGNMLRLSAVQRAKVRKGYWKRSTVSGKMKWKPPKSKGKLQELKVRLSVNPQVYHISALHNLRPGAKVGPYTVTLFDASTGVINFSARLFGDNVEAADVLGALRAIYDVLERKALQ